MCFLFGSMDQRNLILEELNRCNSSLKFTYGLSKTSTPFLGAYLTGTFPLICTSSAQIGIKFYIAHHLILILLNAPLVTVRP